MPYCSNCGNKVSETAKFCPNCGMGIVCSKSSEGLKNGNNTVVEVKETTRNWQEINTASPISQIDINPKLAERNDLIFKLIDSWRKEYIKVLKVVLIINVILSILFILVMSNEWYSASFGFIIITSPFWLPNIPITIYRNIKATKIRRFLRTHPNTEIKAEIGYSYTRFLQKVENSLVITIGDFVIRVPHIFIPIPKEECIKIINSI